MNNRHRLLMLLLTLILLAAITSTAASQGRSSTNADLSWLVIGAGGGHGTSTSYTVDATLGQPIADRGTGATTHLSAGFWQIESADGYRVFLPLVLK